MNFLMVFVGGGLGSICRYGIARWMAPLTSTFPYATFIANALSCILLGLLIGLETKSGLSQNFRHLLIVGFCGGFSTFSTFSYETFGLLETGEYASAFANIILSLLVCLCCVFVGLKLVS